MARGVTVWFTGLSGSGKTTIALEIARILGERGRHAERLDGDVVRRGLSRDLGFSKADRDRNIERVTYVAQMLTRSGVVVIAAFISPYREMRAVARREIGEFLEVHVTAPWDILLERDVKGLYKKALAGEIKDFTGVDDPYEAPEHPDLVLDTSIETVAQSAAHVVALLEERGYIDVRTGDASGVRLAPAEAALARGAPTEMHWTRVPGPIAPHGGVLVSRELLGEAGREALDRANRLPKVVLDAGRQCDLEMIGTGAASPLVGFMGRLDYECVVDASRLSDGLVWSIPVVLPVDKAQAGRIADGQEVALVDDTNRVLGLMRVTEKFGYDKAKEAERVYGTKDPAHPGVARVLAQGEVLLGGPVWLLERPALPIRPLTPLETRLEIERRGWKTVTAFQTRNPVHRAHEYLQKVALELTDGLLLHPLVGLTKDDDLPAATRWKTYEVIVDKYYPKDRVLLAAFPAAMRYAGPREAIFHAIARKNYGCTHMIVGRDHAGVGSYYGTYDAQHIFDRFTPAELGITPLKFEHSFYCRSCGGMGTRRTCPHDTSHHVQLSGTKVRELLRAGKTLPVEFTRPEVAAILLEQEALAASR